MLPFAAQHHLEMRHRVAGDFAADTVETQVGDVVLAATVEAAADLDVQIFDGFVEFEDSFRPAACAARRQPARRGDAQFAGVRARASDDVDNGAGARHRPDLRRCSALYSSGRSPWLTQRITKFCSTVVRIVSRVKRRTISASERN